MIIYLFLMCIILINSVFLKNRRKAFILTSFGLLIIVAALRKDTVGVDLYLHYAPNFETIARLDWGNVGGYFTGVGQYDIGYVFFCKALSLISGDKQFFIFVTSVIILGSLARFIYRYSSRIELDTLLVLTTFTYFQYMCLIAQALALAIVLNGISYLNEKKYWKYICVVFLASTIHISAMICLVFIPLQWMELKRKNIFIFLGCMIMGLVAYQKIMPIIVNTFFNSFSFYIGQEKHGIATGLGITGIYYLLMFALCIMLGIICEYGGKREIEQPMRRQSQRHWVIKVGGLRTQNPKEKTIQGFQLPFLIYMAIGAFFFYTAGLQVQISRRFIYYFSPFAYLALGQSLTEMKNRKMAQILYYLTVFFTIAEFLFLGENMAKSGSGTVPYFFFWQ